MTEIAYAMLFLAGGTWLAGVFGAAGAAPFKRNSIVANTLVPAFAAGVILMVAFVELLHPAIHLAERTSVMPAWIVVPGSFAAGFLIAATFAMHIEKSQRFKCKQGVMLLSALSAHSVPEGLALGVLLAATGGIGEERLLVLAPVFLAVALHKFPEGAAVAALFRSDGKGKFASFVFGQASGFLAFVSGAIGFAVVVNFDAALPFAMAFAAGAMLRVATGELIPHAKSKNFHLCAAGIFFGIFLMLFVDTTLHLHHNGCACEEHTFIWQRSQSS